MTSVEDIFMCTVLLGLPCPSYDSCFLYTVLSPYVPSICYSGTRIHLLVYPFNISEANWSVSKYINPIGLSRVIDSQVIKQYELSGLCIWPCVCLCRHKKQLSKNLGKWYRVAVTQQLSKGKHIPDVSWVSDSCPEVRSRNSAA